MKLIECVPNFSEGQNIDIINQITSEITKVSNVKLLDVDPGKDTNRTVVTFVGEPDSVITAAFNSIKKASELIDMRTHKGEHPRMGATDVCPIVPISNCTIDECIEYSNTLADLVGKELNIPVFLYEKSASTKDRVNLANIRKGEYEGMAQKLLDIHWKPDYGPKDLNERAGVTAIGVRNFLIAYNVNINSTDRRLASDIALDIREAGRAKRDKDGNILRNKNGTIKKKAGTLKNTKAVGWYIDEYSKAQVSINLTDYVMTPLHEVFEEVRRQARLRGLRVTGSEIVGLVPKSALIEAGKFYLKKQNKCISLPENNIIHTAIESLGLNDISNFNKDESIIENRIDNTNNTLVSKNVKDFIDEVSIDSPAPGGGSVSALAGALSSALVSMVSNLSYGKKGYQKNNIKFNEIGFTSQEIKSNLLSLVDKDTLAFNAIMDSFKLPKKSESDISIRNRAIQEATINAIEVPLDIMAWSYSSLLLIKKIIKIGNKNSLSDIGVAFELAHSSVMGGYYNVLINMRDIDDKKYIRKQLKKADKIVSNLNKESIKIRSHILKSL